MSNAILVNECHEADNLLLHNQAYSSHVYCKADCNYSIKEESQTKLDIESIVKVLDNLDVH